MALGLFAAGFLIEACGPVAKLKRLTIANLFGFIPLVIGLNVAILHLGRPLKAYRALRGIRTSWLSREIAGFNLFAVAAVGAIAWGIFGVFDEKIGDYQILLSAATVVTGVIAVTCSAMLYVVTGRPLWSGFRTHALFFMTAAVLGISGLLFLFNLVSSDRFAFLSAWLTDGQRLISQEELARTGKLLCKWLMIAVSVKLVLEAALFTHLNSFHFTPQRHAARLMIGDMRIQTVLRFSLAIIAGLIMPLLVLSDLKSPESVFNPGGLPVIAFVMFGSLLFAELIERYLFFAVTVARRMPGSPN
jgi:formate dehydrogenase iron-sulfur subunit